MHEDKAVSNKATEERRPVSIADTTNACAGRMNARAVILERAARLHRQANALEGLARAIPENFPHDADEALWELAISSNR
jgi:hypothetical protein